MNKGSIVLFCGVLMSLSAFSIDITLPFFTEISNDLDVPLAGLPLTVTVFLFCLGASQLFFGVISDAYGRRVALAVGLILFAIGTLLAVLSSSVLLLLVARGVQGAGAASAIVLSRSILRDLAAGDQLARHMAVASAIFTIGPVLAPLLGALFILNGGGWRLIFFAMLCYAGVLLFVCVILLPETNRNRNRNSIRLTLIKRRFREVIGHPQSRWFMLVHAVCQTGMLLIVSTMAPLYHNLFGISGITFAVLFAVHTVGIIVGQILNHYMIGRYGALVAAMIATGFMITSGLSVSLLALAGFASAYLITALITLYAVGYLSAAANTASLVLNSHGEIAGFASALHGTLTLLCSAFLATAIGWFIQTSAVNWGMALSLLSLLALAMMWRWLRAGHERAGAA